MAVLKPKTRIVSFRLSEEEYECLRQKSLAQGTHSTSDCARAAVLLLLADRTAAPADEFEVKIAQLDEKMRQVERELQRLARAVQQHHESHRTELLCLGNGLR
jgi:hypothetical protein